MTRWLFCPECKTELTSNEYGPTCPDGHFTKYPTPVAATVGLVEFDGKYLVIRRSREPRKGYWDLPGGFVEPGETAEETLHREIKEETGLSVKTGAYIGTFPSVYGDTDIDTLATTYVFHAKTHEVRLSEENDDYCWLKLSEMPEMAFVDCDQAIEKLRNNL